VVYKVDRLTRSLADFAKLVELFDAHNVSFVSVTQQFNTTTSMGRLTLNVLLSFAQFEREVTSERIRDKIAASKRNGLWVGGPLPLGYELKDGKLTVVEEEAERVRMIFRRYLEVSGTNELVRDLRAKNICTKARTYSTTGKTRGGIPFGRGALSYFLRNRFFFGEVKYKGEVLPGEQPPIMDKSLFEAVQQKLSAYQSHKTSTGGVSEGSTSIRPMSMLPSSAGRRGQASSHVLRSQHEQEVQLQHEAERRSVPQGLQRQPEWTPQDHPRSANVHIRHRGGKDPYGAPGGGTREITLDARFAGS
jgi:hypothetical protein